MHDQLIPHGYCQCGCGRTTPIAKSSNKTKGYVRGEPLRYVIGHPGRPPGRTPAIGRVLDRVEKTESGCWVFQCTPTPRGYGKINDGGVPRLAHRVVYEAKVGPIPDGMTLDHLCHNTLCVNPGHLEPVSASENTRRQWRDGKANAGVRQREKTHCRNGHPYDEQNTYLRPNGDRACRTCRRDQS